MKKLLKFAAIFGMTTLLSFSLKAQVPQGINYQAVARDGSGNILNSTNLDVKIGIYDGPSTSGTLVYEETIAVTTSVYGVFGLVIGTGTASTGVFNTIDWANGDYYTKIDVDLGAGFVNLSESKLQSVPFSLHANTANSVINKQWDEDAISLSTTKKVGVNGIPSGNYRLEVQGTLSDSTSIYAYNSSLSIMGISTNGPTFGVLGVQSKTNLFGMTINSGKEIGMMGVSTGGSNTDNYGVIGFSNYKAGWFVNTNGSEALLGGTVNAAEFLHGGVLIDSVTTDPAPKTFYGNSGPIAYGYVNGATSLATNYGVTSVASPSTGVYTITLNNNYAGQPVVVATSLNNSSDTEIITYSATSNSNVITIRIVNESNAAINSNFSFVVYGTPQ